jgi:nucleotide-binding universal stress UspA family protein
MVPSVILCPVDFSAATALLVDYAATLARAMGAELRLLYVRESASPALSQSACREALALLNDLQCTAHLAGTRYVSIAVRTGEAAAEIVADAIGCVADLIVIGAHGCTHLNRFLMGSTAEQVLRTSPCLTLLLTQHSSPLTGY